MKEEVNINRQVIKTTKPKKFCFVLMPFDEEFGDVYELGIKQSCIDAGIYCERVDEQIFDGSILERIYNQISKADIIIVDVTDRNPNVFYEVGYAHALGKITILLTKNAEDIPFDLKHYPHIIYNHINKLKKELTKRVKWFAENEITSDNDLKIGIDVYLGEKNLSSEKVVYNVLRYPFALGLIIHNNTFNTYNPQDYRVGIITDKELYIDNFETIQLPDKKFLHMCPIATEILYPNLYIDLRLFLYLRSDISYGEEENITIRIFTSAGTRDFYLTLNLSKWLSSSIHNTEF